MMCQRENGPFQAAHTVPIITDNQAGRPGTQFKGYLPYARFSMVLHPAAEMGKKRKKKLKICKSERFKPEPKHYFFISHFSFAKTPVINNSLSADPLNVL